MSQRTAQLRSGRPGQFRSSQLRSTTAQQSREAVLRLVRPVQSRASRAPFVVVMLVLLAAGLTGLLLLSTRLQAQAFTISRLTQQQNTLQMKKQSLVQDVDQLSSPQRIADAASRQKMVPGPAPKFLRLSDGAVLGSSR